MLAKYGFAAAQRANPFFCANDPACFAKPNASPNSAALEQVALGLVAVAKYPRTAEKQPERCLSSSSRPGQPLDRESG